MNRIKKNISEVFYALTAFVLISALYTACTLQPGGGNGGGGSTSSSGSSSSGPAQLSVIYVATNGSDLNSGSNKTEPFLTIQKAVDRAADGAVINVAEGIYTNGDGLNSNGNNGFSVNKNNLRFLGGWDSGFTIRQADKYSALDGNHRLAHIISINNATNVLIDGFIIRNGSAGSEYGGGLLLMSSSFCVVTNCIVSNNSSGNYGGGICIYTGASNAIDAFVCCNSAFNSGGGIYINNSTYNLLKGNIISNSGNTYGGGIIMDISSYNIIDAVISNNTAQYGGGISMYGCSNNSIGGQIYCNKADENNGEGGGLYIFNACLSNVISSIVTGNSARYGGGLYLESSYNAINGIITGNRAYYYGGVCVAGSYNTINGTINANTATNYGGVIVIGQYNRISAVICSNYGTNGGVSFVTYASNNIISNSILLYNQADYGVINLYKCGINQFISNTIGGQGTGYGIYEENTDISNHTLINNIFLTNKLSSLYHDFANGDIGLTETGVLNTPNDPRHDASTTGGNTASNE